MYQVDLSGDEMNTLVLLCLDYSPSDILINHCYNFYARTDYLC